MNENVTPPLDENGGTAVVQSAEITRSSATISINHRRTGLLAPVLMVGVAIALRLAFVDVPRALADTWWWDGRCGGWIKDYPCTDCEQCPPPGGCSPFADNTGDASCSGCGMAIWGVSEPMMCLWLRDEPMSYQPSRGKPISFQLFYKSHPDDTTADELDQTIAPVFSLGRNWFTPWRSYLLSDTGDPNYHLVNGRGGMASLPATCGDLVACVYSNCLVREPIGLNTNNYPTITYASGAQDVFGDPPIDDGYHTRTFLTEKIDANGNVTHFGWSTINGVSVLDHITDVDNNVTTFTYTNINNYVLLYQVSDPCGHTTTLDYDQSQLGLPNLTNITDAVNLPSWIQYDANTGLASALITRYGTNTFTYFDSPPAIHVNALGLRDYLYMYVHTNTYCQMTNSYQAWCPSTVKNGVFSFPNTFDYSESDQRNSFFWGPRQYNLLPTSFLESLTNNDYSLVDLSQLYTTNYIQARQRHWLIDSANNQPDNVLSLERAPSPDGTTQGQITWYDYEGKSGGSPHNEGPSAFPRFQAWTLPNGESRFIRWERNDWGKPTQVVETYSDAAGSLKSRTNTLVYAANSIDLVSQTNALGFQVLSNMFNANHQIRTNFNVLGEMTVYTYDPDTHALLTKRTPSGLTTSNYYGGDGYLAQTVDLEIGRANSYTWSNGLIASHTDERGLTLNFAWDGLNRLLKTTHPDSKYVTNIYDKLDLVMVIDRMGFTNRYEYNGFHQVLHYIDALSRTNTYTYCDCGDPETSKDPLGNVTTFFHDLAYRRTQITYPDNYTLTYNYNALGQLTNTTDGTTSTTNWFNNQGLLTTASNGVGRVQTLVYDILDRTITNIDANAISVGTTYDDLNRVRTRAYPDNGSEKFVYTANISGPTSYTNQVNNTVLYAYDPASRKTNEVYSGVTTNRFSFDPSGNLTNLTDGKLQTTAWKYDEYSRVTNKVDAANNVLFVYTYDLDNRLTNRWSTAKTNTVYRYDPVGNLTNIVYPVSHAISFVYDPNGA